MKTPYINALIVTSITLSIITALLFFADVRNELMYATGVSAAVICIFVLVVSEEEKLERGG